MDEPKYPISVAAKLAGISIPTLRMYEREGLIIPFKKQSNQRLYTDRDLERIHCIRQTINEDKINIEGMRRILALIPCWAIVHCSEEDRASCEAYNSHNKPCWMINHKNNFCSNRDCLDCEVYKAYGNCASIKDKLKELLK